MTSNRTGFAWLLALAWLLGAPAARADTWAPPEVMTVQSANGSARATITPSRFYGQRGEPTPTARVRVERHVGHETWRVVREGPLLNSTAPVDVLVSDDAATLVTFDNHHSMGFGDDVVVIYDATGHVVRKLSLEQLLPAAWIEATRRSVSSIWWRGDKSAIVDDGRTLLIDVVAPGQSGREDPLRTVPLLVSLDDGEPLDLQRPEWSAALRELVDIVARRDAAWARHRALQAALLFAPAGRDRRAWRDFMELARERLKQRTGGHVFGMVLMTDVAPGACCDAADLIASALGERGRYAAHYVFVSPDGPRMQALLEARLADTKPGALAGLTLWIPASAADAERLRAAAVVSGMKIERIDLEAGMEGVELPMSRPAGYTGEDAF